MYLTSVSLRSTRLQTKGLISTALLVATVAVFGATCRNGFVDYDDRAYIVNNPHVTAGLTAADSAWAWTTLQECHWHPLTWLSLQLDATVYGIIPFGFHFTNLLLHSCSAVVLFLILLGMTGRLWPSATVAALFAWHPLHVESVAWAAERKDVLSGFFGVLCLGSYFLYATDLRRGRYLQVLALFMLALLSKPTVLTLPMLLLLLDWWPLGRWKGAMTGEPEWRGTSRSRQQPMGELVVEKLPLFALAAVSCAVTWVAQHRSGVENEAAPALLRLQNSVVSYARYLGKIFWPTGLAPYYPFPKQFFSWTVTAAALALFVGLGVIAVVGRRRRPHLFVGWFWFVGMLMPMIGLFQVLGGHALADRYSYLPIIGIFLAIAWEVAVWIERRPSLGTPAFVAALLVLIVIAGLSQRQIGYWRDSFTLWRHTLAVIGPSDFVEHNLSVSLVYAGRRREAISHLAEAARLNPENGSVQSTLGRTLLQEGEVNAAIEPLRSALRLKPWTAEAHAALGEALTRQGHLAEGERELREAERERPGDLDAATNLGINLKQQGRVDVAIAQYENVLRQASHHGAAHYNLGIALVEQGRLHEAELHFTACVHDDPKDASAYGNLGMVLMRQGRAGEAVPCYQRAVERDPQRAALRYYLAYALEKAGQSEAATVEYRGAEALDRGWPMQAGKRAWMLATDPERRNRNGQLALFLAGTACAAENNREASLLGVLAAAYAEVGEFEGARRVSRQAIKQARATRQTQLADQLEVQQQFYLKGKPYRTPTVSSAR